MGFTNQQQRVGGGATPIWLDVNGIIEGGGKIDLSKIPKADRPALIPVGTPAYQDKMGGDVTLLETFRVSKAVSAADTVVEVEAAGSLPRVKKGQFLMKEPATYGTEGKGIAAGEITDGSDDYTKNFAIEANALGVLKVGDILVAATKAGDDARIATTPNGLLRKDLYVRPDDYIQLCSVVDDGVILGDRISPVPQCVKNANQTLKFRGE